MTEPKTQTPGHPPRLELKNISKSFPGILANDQVDLCIMPGEIHGLIGENGAGKSTLVKIVYGLLQASEGQILWAGNPVSIPSPNIARKLGIGMVFQHFSLFDALTVAENIALGIHYKGRFRDLAASIVETASRYQLPIKPGQHVTTLSTGEKQRVEIIRCLLQDPKLLIMDEPTSVLTPQETKILFTTLTRLAQDGCSILFISHKLEEVRELCSKASILRAGRIVGQCDPRSTPASAMAEMMIGKTLPPTKRSRKKPGPIALELKDLTIKIRKVFATSLKGINLEIRAGEIFGIAGIAGNGQYELARALTGELKCPGKNMIHIKGKPSGHLSPRRRRVMGMCFIPDERLGRGAVPDMDLTENVILTAHRAMKLTRYGFIKFSDARKYAGNVIEAYNVKSRGIDAPARSLSGGNLQKFIIGRETMQEPDILIAIQPTWGVDTGAETAIHEALIDLAGKNAAVLVISQDLDELLKLTDRLAVLHNGELSPARPTGSYTVEEIGLLMGGADQKMAS